jgi:integrase
MSTAKRRKKGTGNLTHLGGERWEYRFYVEGLDGRLTRPSRTFTAKNETEAERTAARIYAEVARRPATETSDKRTWTVERYIDHYFESYCEGNLAVKTVARYRQMARCQIVPAIGHLRVRDVTPSDLQRLYGRLRRDGGRSDGRPGALSDQTIYHVHRFLHALFNHAVGDEVRETTPADLKKTRIKTPKRKPVTLLDADRVEGLLTVFREAQDNGSRLYLPVLLAADTGARRGEVLALRWADLDFEDGTITIRRALQDSPGEVVTKTTKTGEERVVPLFDDTLIAELKRAQREQRERRLLFGSTWRGAKRPGEDYICATLDGSPWRPARFTHTYRAFCKAKGFPEVNYHAFRHAFASMGSRAGIDAVTMGELLGHSPDVFLKVYAHAFKEAKRDAVARIAEARKEAREAL